MASSSTSPKHHYSFSPATCFLATGLVTEVLLAVNLVYSCYTTFDCTTFWPTLSYMAVFSGHDRLFAFTLTQLSFSLPLFFLAIQAQFRSVLSVFANAVMLITWLGICILLPTVALIDEANASNVAPLSTIHYWLMVGVISLSLLWTGTSLVAIQEGKKEAGWKGMKEVSYLKKYVCVTLLALGVTVVEWTLAGSIYANSVMNETVEAVCEWTTVSLAVFAPYTYVHAFPSLEISFVGS